MDKPAPKLQIDAEFEHFFPALSPDEYANLEADIVAHGCREPLTVWEGVIVDGHNRYQICTEHSIPFKVFEQDFDSRDAVMFWMFTHQLARRNLQDVDRFKCAKRVEPYVRQLAKERQKTSTGGTNPQLTPKTAEAVKGETRDELAKMAGMGHTKFRQFESIYDEGSPEQIKRLESGGTGNTPHAIYNEIHPRQKRATEPPLTPASPPEKPKAMFDRLTSELKDESKDASCTPELFLAEYQGFASKFLKSLEWYRMDYYLRVYPLMSEEEHKKITALNTDMLKAVEKIDQLQKGNHNEKVG